MVILLRQVAKQTLRSWWWLFKLFFTDLVTFYRRRSNVPTNESAVCSGGVCLCSIPCAFKHTCSDWTFNDRFRGARRLSLAALSIYVIRTPQTRINKLKCWKLLGQNAVQWLLVQKWHVPGRSVRSREPKEEKQRCRWSVKNPTLLITPLLFVIGEMLTLCKREPRICPACFCQAATTSINVFNPLLLNRPFGSGWESPRFSSSIINTTTFANNEGSDV